MNALGEDGRYLKRVVFTPEQEADIIQRHSSGERMVDIAALFGYKCAKPVADVLHRHGIKTDRSFYMSPEEIESAKQRYEAGEDLKTLARSFNVWIPNLKITLAANGVTLRVRCHSQEMADKLIDLYKHSGMATLDICKSLGVTTKVFHRLVRDLGISRVVPLKRKERSTKGMPLLDQMIAKRGEVEGRKAYERTIEKHRKNSSGEGNPMYGKPSPSGSGNGWKGWYREFYFRSFRELTFLIRAERDGISWAPGEKVSIPYVFDGVERTYRPDFIIGDCMVELKPKRLIKTPGVQAKADAAKNYCAANGLTYEIFDPGIDSDLIQHAYEAGLIRFVGDYEQRFLDYISPVS